MMEEPLLGYLSNNKVLIEIDEDKRNFLHDERGYGEVEDNKLVLSPVEALYLCKLGWLKIVEETSSGKEISFQELVEKFSQEDENLWISYLVYSDLRSRGYIVRGGFLGGVNFRVYERGSHPSEKAAKYLVYTITEGKPLSLVDLARIVGIARNARKELLLAVVNRQGETTYYNVTSITL